MPYRLICSTEMEKAMRLIQDFFSSVVYFHQFLWRQRKEVFDKLVTTQEGGKYWFVLGKRPFMGQWHQLKFLTDYIIL